MEKNVKITQKIELKNKFSKVTEYKVNIWKTTAFLYTNNQLAEKETKKAISFIIVPKKKSQELIYIWLPFADMSSMEGIRFVSAISN
jgi:hypothetical protein